MELLLPAKRQQKLCLRLLGASAVKEPTSSACLSRSAIVSRVLCLRGEFFMARAVGRRGLAPGLQCDLNRQRLAVAEDDDLHRFAGLVGPQHVGEVL